MNREEQLLNDYVERHSHQAFAEIVESRIGLVYAVALRQVGGDAHLAKDVAQIVFTELARRAPDLLRRRTIGGWLWSAAHHTAVDIVRSERRRKAREQRSELMSDPHHNPAGIDPSPALGALVDRAMAKLRAADRDVLTLRFYDAKAFAEIGALLRTSENAAHKRVERALYRLARILRQAGVTSTAAAISTALAQDSSLTLPAGIGVEVSGSALAGAAASSASIGFASLLASSKPTIAVAAVAVAAAIAALIEYDAAAAARVRATVEEQQARQWAEAAGSARLSLKLVSQRARAAEDDVARLLAGIDRMSAAHEKTTAELAPAPNTPAKSVHLQMIQIPRENGMTDADLMNEGKVILGLFRSGEDFSVLAANYSSDLHHAKGGDWGWVTPLQIKAAMREAIFTLKLGDASTPVLLPEGCFIFYAAERRF